MTKASAAVEPEQQEDSLSSVETEAPVTVVERSGAEMPQVQPEPTKKVMFWNVDLLAWAKGETLLISLCRITVFFCVCFVPISLWTHNEFIGMFTQIIGHQREFISRPSFPSRPKKELIVEVSEPAGSKIDIVEDEM